MKLPLEFLRSWVVARTGVGIPATLETGQPEGCPARATIILTAKWLKNHCPKNGCTEAKTQKNTRGACCVAKIKLGFLRPATDFAVARKLYNDRLPDKRLFSFIWTFSLAIGQDLIGLLRI